MSWAAGRKRSSPTSTPENLDHDACNWIALDDIALVFSRRRGQNLVLTDSSKGFTEQEGEKLLEWYNRS